MVYEIAKVIYVAPLMLLVMVTPSRLYFDCPIITGEH